MTNDMGMDASDYDVETDELLEAIMHEEILGDLLKLQKHERVRAYWKFSRLYHGFGCDETKGILTIGLLILTLRALQDAAYIKGDHILIPMVVVLLQDVIMCNVKHKGSKAKQTNNVVQLFRRKLADCADCTSNTTLINNSAIKTGKISHARQHYCNQTLKEINHPLPTQRNACSHNLAFAYLEASD